MRGKEFLEKLENIDPAYIEAANIKVSKNQNRFKRFAAMAACFIIALSLGVGIRTYAAEIQEYNDAIEFFEDHGLSTDGLSRKEIKTIYRDITTKSFSYSKTGEVIMNSMTEEQIQGYEIWQGEPTPEDIERLWNHKNYNGEFIITDKNDILYDYRLEYADNGYIDFEKSYFEKFSNNTLVWSVSFSEFIISGYSEISDGVIVYGNAPDNYRFDWIAKIDKNGNIIWKQKHVNNFSYEMIVDVIENSEGNYDVISRGDSYYFCLTKYSPTGEKLHFKKSEIGNFGIWNIERFTGGYIALIGNFVEGEKIIRIDSDGNITESFAYSDESFYYHVTDMIEFNGRIYLSAYTTPVFSETNTSFCYYELRNIVDYLITNNIFDISSDELTPMIRENYTAVLLVCDPSTGSPEQFFSVKGSMGAELSITESGELLWDVESITTTFYSPATSSFTFGGNCYIFEYTFNTSGTLVSQNKTGEITNFRK